MVYFAELNKTGEEHAVINGSLLQMISHIFNGEKIVFWGSKVHFDKLERGNLDIYTHFIRVRKPKDKDKFNWILKFLTEIIFIFRILICANRDNVRFIFFSSLSVFGNYTLKILASLLFRKIPLIIMLHGELELLRRNSVHKKVDRYYGFILEKALKKRASNIKYLVLGEFIKDMSLELGLLKEDQILVIDHPFTFPRIDTHPRMYSIPHFGHIGVAKKSKNSHLFFKLAEQFSKEIALGQVKFSIIGMVLNDMKGYVSGSVECVGNDKFVERHLYEKYISEIDYSIFLYDDNNYGLTGSGAIMDAISYQKPILCLKNRYFSQLFANEYHRPGWTFNNIEELSQKITEIIGGKERDTYMTQVSFFDPLKNQFSISQIEKQLAGELAYIK